MSFALRYRDSWGWVRTTGITIIISSVISSNPGCMLRRHVAGITRTHLTYETDHMM
jgi:hypothetical protein